MNCYSFLAPKVTTRALLFSKSRFWFEKKVESHLQTGQFQRCHLWLIILYHQVFSPKAYCKGPRNSESDFFSESGSDFTRVLLHYMFLLTVLFRYIHTYEEELQRAESITYTTKYKKRTNSKGNVFNIVWENT